VLGLGWPIAIAALWKLVNFAIATINKNTEALAAFRILLEARDDGWTPPKNLRPLEWQRKKGLFDSDLFAVRFRNVRVIWAASGSRLRFLEMSG